MNEEDLKNITRKLSVLEQHIINLIYPIQGIASCLKDSSQIDFLIKQLSKPLVVDDKNLIYVFKEFRAAMEQFRRDIEMMQKLDMKQAFDEIKYIGKRLNTIEETLIKIHDQGIQKHINLEFTMDGYRMIKRPINYDESEPIEDPNKKLKELFMNLYPREAKAIIHRLGLFGESKKTYSEIAKLFKTDRQRCCALYKKAIVKLRQKERLEMVRETHCRELIKEVFGEY